MLFSWKNYASAKDHTNIDYSALLFPFAVPALAATDCCNAIMLSIAGKTLGLQALEVLPPEDYAYSIIDGSASPQQFPWIRAKIRNKITSAALNSGTLTAYALFRERTDYDPNLLNDPPTPESRAEGFSHRTSVSLDVVQFSAGGEMELVFDFRENPIPAGITDLVFYLLRQAAIRLCKIRPMLASQRCGTWPRWSGRCLPRC